MKSFAVFLFSLALSSFAFADRGAISIGHNENGGAPEHIDSVEITVNGVIFPNGDPLNTLDNDSEGYVSFAANLDQDPAAKLILTVSNQISSGHKVTTGSQLFVTFGDGTNFLIGTVSGTPVERNALSYQENLSLAANVSANENTILNGSPHALYFRNALDACMLQMFQSVTVTKTLQFGSRTLTAVSEMNKPVGSERLAPGHCQ